MIFRRVLLAIFALEYTLTAKADLSDLSIAWYTTAYEPFPITCCNEYEWLEIVEGRVNFLA